MYVIVDLQNGQELVRASDMDTLIKRACAADDTGAIFKDTYIGKEQKKVNKSSGFVWIFYNAWHENYIAIPERDFINGELIGVIIAGRPVSRYFDFTTTLEVTRCCVLEGFKNAVSKLYGQICKVAKATGYKKIITYTLVTEQGASMKAVGFKQDCLSKGGSWNSSSRNRVDNHPTIQKYRWIKELC